MIDYLKIWQLAGTTPTGDAEGETENVAEAEFSAPVKHEEEDFDVMDSESQFLCGLVECRVTDPIVSSFLAYIHTCSSAHNLLSPIDFPLDHPVQEVVRYFF